MKMLVNQLKNWQYRYISLSYFLFVNFSFLNSISFRFILSFCFIDDRSSLKDLNNKVENTILVDFSLDNFFNFYFNLSNEEKIVYEYFIFQYFILVKENKEHNVNFLLDDNKENLYENLIFSNEKLFYLRN